MSSIIDGINAGAIKTMTVGQRYTISGISVVEMENSFNPEQKRPVVIVETPDGTRYYAPANVGKVCAGKTEEEISELIGTVLEVTTYYSNRLRREVKVARILTEDE